MDWSLLGCGRSGHVTYAPAEPGVRKHLTAQTESGDAWRCLRCGAYVVGQPQRSGPAAQAPEVRRGREVRSAFILRIFAVERFLRALAVGALAFVVWRFEYARESIEQAFNRERPILRDLFHQLGYNIDNSKLVGLIQHALTLSPTSIRLVAIGLTCYAVIEVIEAVGLWQARRWGEYFAMVATSLGLPYEIYDLATRPTLTAGILFAVNLVLVLYLVITKRLFRVRGGKRAYEARLRSESIMEAAIETANAEHPERGTTPDAAAQAGKGATGPADAGIAASAPHSATAPSPDTAPQPDQTAQTSHGG
ncbi:MAG TPA: DUF2127 domain-containing protein [Streptosporangiaceae bacterium]|jgi:uncharacterized membrane protein (DUF2068 family)|nr:DUF2127 domain-containing protein [Streptosporangiaceae bacterium]